MHAGAPFFDETLALMRDHPGVHVDISVINNPGIVRPEAFAAMMQALLDAGLGERIMFGSDNADITTTRRSLDALPFLDDADKQAILHGDAHRFFRLEQSAGEHSVPGSQKIDVDAPPSQCKGIPRQARRHVDHDFCLQTVRLPTSA